MSEANVLVEADSKRWDSIWEDRVKDDSDWDYLSEVVFLALKENLGEFKDKMIVETGSGTGRISSRLARLSAKAVLLDYSLIALNSSRRMFDNNRLRGYFLAGDISALPLKDDSCDMVWNAGVMEHYKYEEQSRILKGLIAACAKGGIVITLNPYARSMFYNLGKRILIMLNHWPFGKEYPIRTIRDIYKEAGEGRVVKEYSIGFIVFFVDMYKFLPKKIQRSKMVKAVSGFFIRYGAKLSSLDKFLSAIFGGYLLVSVIKKR